MFSKKEIGYTLARMKDLQKEKEDGDIIDLKINEIYKRNKSKKKNNMGRPMKSKEWFELQFGGGDPLGSGETDDFYVFVDELRAANRFCSIQTQVI